MRKWSGIVSYFNIRGTDLQMKIFIMDLQKWSGSFSEHKIDLASKADVVSNKKGCFQVTTFGLLILEISAMFDLQVPVYRVLESESSSHPQDAMLQPLLNSLLLMLASSLVLWFQLEPKDEKIIAALKDTKQPFLHSSSQRQYF